MGAKSDSVLVVDDDTSILHMIESILRLEGYHVRTATDGETALDILVEDPPDVVLLDIMMPTLDGYAVCTAIRQMSQMPIIIVTAQGEETAKLRGLDAGADDYIVKPFSPKELTARVRAVLRRSKIWDTRYDPEFHFQDLTVDYRQHAVSVEGQQVDLTPTEYKMLTYLTRNAGRMLSTDQILEEVWGEEYSGERSLVKVIVTRIRRKLNDDPRNPQYILTKTGIGYMMKAPE